MRVDDHAAVPDQVVRAAGGRADARQPGRRRLDVGDGRRLGEARASRSRSPRRTGARARRAARARQPQDAVTGDARLHRRPGGRRRGPAARPGSSSRRRANARRTPSPFLRGQSMPTNRKRGVLQSRSSAGARVVAADADDVDLLRRDPVVVDHRLGRPAARQADGRGRARRSRCWRSSRDLERPLGRCRSSRRRRAAARLGDRHVLEGRDRHLGLERVAGADLDDAVERPRLAQPLGRRPRVDGGDRRGSPRGRAAAQTRPLSSRPGRR